MEKRYLWTKSKTRLCFSHVNPGKNYNWLFLPGGPGLGSESLSGLTEILCLPGSVWYVDFPGDGSNTTADDVEYFSHWSEALIEVTRALPNVVLVAHSSGGMFALAVPELENNLIGLVLMGSSPNSSWQQFFTRYIKENPLVEAEGLQAQYDKHPSNALLKNLTIACAPYFSLNRNLQQIISLLKSLPFNYKTQLWAAKNFDPLYKAKWVPKTIPTLIFSGKQDHITPLKLFLDADEFQRENILIREIENAAHFPWIDNPHQVKQVFDEYCQRI